MRAKERQMARVVMRRFARIHETGNAQHRATRIARFTAIRAALLVIASLPAGCFSMSAVPPPPGSQRVQDATRHERAIFDASAPAFVESDWGRSGSFVLVSPRVNGRDVGWFILDTGASGCTMTSTAARAAGAVAVGSTLIQGSDETTVFRCDSLSLGPFRVEDVHVTGLDMERSSLPFGREIAGILGRNVFESAIVVLDGPSRSVRLLDPAAPDSIERATTILRVTERGADRADAGRIEWIPITMQRELPHVPVAFDGDREASFILDTGADATIHFFADTVDQNDLLESQGVRVTGTKTQVTFGRRASISDGTIEDLRLGSRQVGPSKASFARPGDGVSKHLGGSAGLVGMGIMRNFVVVIDEPGRRVAFLKPSK
ncbi:MAG: hypothetical protein FJ253_07555 [Phycisphaerae bacterium]|nr:hypothetical protein [Phycisphaerae bacterium]